MLLYRPPLAIVVHDHLNLITQDTCEVFTRESQALHSLIESLDSGTPPTILEQSHLSKGVSSNHLPQFLTPLHNRHTPRLNYEERISLIAFTDYDLPLLENQRNQHSPNEVPLCGSQTLKEFHVLNEEVVLLELFERCLLNHITESSSINSPESAITQRLHRGRPWCIVQQSQFTERVRRFKGLLHFAIYDDLALTPLDQEVRASPISLLKHILLVTHYAVEDFLSDFFPICR